MSVEKEEILQQITDIKTYLIDRQTFFPYDYRAYYVWGFISMVLVLMMVPMYKVGIVEANLVLVGLLFTGFLVEGALIKRVNKNYDIEACTTKQASFMKMFILLSLFLVGLSTILAIYNLYIPILLSWLFFVSLSQYIVGVVLQITYMQKLFLASMSLAIVLLFIAILTNTLQGVESPFFRVVQLSTIVGLSFFISLVAWRQRKEQLSV
jgi:predicted neutral ceramidase superfamily lipid hydrolase